MELELVPVQMDVPKDAKEVVDAVARITGALIRGEGLEGVSAHLPIALKAAEGFNNVAPAIKSQHWDEVLGYMTKHIGQALDKSQPKPS